MKRIFLLLFFTVSFLSFCQKRDQSKGFIENKGQIVDQNGKQNTAVKYLLNTPGLNVQLKKNGFSYDVYETKSTVIKNSWTKGRAVTDNNQNKPDEFNHETKFHRVDVDFIDYNPNVRLVAKNESKDVDNYYTIASERNGILNVHRFEKITYQNIYNNIDVVFFVPEDRSKPVEYNFIVRPNGKIADIKMSFNGMKTKLSDNKIQMKSRFGLLEETLPLSWTESVNGNDKKEVKVGYREISKNVYRFESEANANDKTIIIDPVPVRLWSTYYGGSNSEFVGSINTDSSNNIIISGSTGSTNNIATSGPNTSGYSGGNSFIAKFDPNGVLLWSSYYPFSTGDLVLDSNDNMYSYGRTLYANSEIPSAGCFQPIKDIYNTCFLIKLNSAGAKMWGTYYGGNGNEEIYNVSVDNSGNVYAVGGTNSSDVFATPGAFQMTLNSLGGYECGFIVKFDSNGNRIWGTFYGGELADGFYNCHVSNDGYLYAIGTHNSRTNITTPGAYQTTYNGAGGMIVKFDLNGNRVWGTFVCDNTYLVRGVFKGNFVYLSGRAFPNRSAVGTPGTMFPNMQLLPTGSTMSFDENSFISKFNLTTQQYLWGTYFIDYINGSDVDASGNVFISGSTGSDIDVTTPDGYMPVKSRYHKSYLIKLNPNGQRTWGTYYGGNIAEQIAFVEIDHNNDIYLYGMTNGSTTGIATINAHQTTLGSNPDTYLAKFRDCLSVTQAASNNPCIGSNLNLTASGGTTYAWSGPNGFTSSLQNPTINSVNASHTGLYSCAITGTAGCDNTISFNVIVGDTVKPIPNMVTLPTINGDCTTTISAPTATDNCAGSITATTTDPLSYPLPGNYTIHWTYNDGNGNSETQNQNVTISAVNLPTVTSPQKFCIQRNATLNDIAITGTNIKWYDAPTGGNRLPATTVLQDGITYYATQTVSSCESLTESVAIQIQNTPAPTGTNQSFCAVQNDTLNDILVNGTAIKWYSNTTNTTELALNTVLADNTTYYASQTVNGCESVGRLPIAIRLIYTLNAVNYATFICDTANDGSENVNLSDYNSFLLNSAGTTFSYFNSNNGAENQIAAEQFTANHSIVNGLNKIYVRIDSTNGCHQVVELQLTLVNVPNIAIPDEIALCENKSITVNAGSGFDSYAWSNGAGTPTIRISQAGNYSVTVTKNHGTVVCSATKNFTVVLSYAPVINSIDTVDWTDNKNSITINTNAGDFEYSIDGENFQSSNIFHGLANGEYTVTVRDKKGCGTTSKVVYLLNYPKFFTPNGDGYNDNWYIRFSSFEPNFKVSIFDRYGKLLKEMNNLEYWDGTHNGKQMPSDDYWFNVTRYNGKTHKGHFALKR